MTTRPIVKYPDPLLHEECATVAEFNEELWTLLDDMAETMYAADGIGLAAPQIGVQKRITVIDVSRENDGVIELINPEIVESTGKVSTEEGCLSIPDYRDYVSRHRTVRVRAQDRHGDEFELDADDLLSICLQHELDHLDGVLFIDRLSKLKQGLFKRWFKKHGPFD